MVPATNPMPKGVHNLGWLKGETVFEPEKHSLGGNKGVLSHSLSKGEAHFYKIPALVPDWSISMQKLNPNLHILIGPLSIVLIG